MHTALVVVGRIVFFALAVLVLPGCTFIGMGVGAGVGAAMPRYEEVDRTAVHPEPGDEVTALMNDGMAVEARVLASDAFVGGDHIEIEVTTSPSEILTIPAAHTRALHHKVGSHWARGMLVGTLIGLALDVAFWTAAALGSHPVAWGGQ
jgi:hypothetical protein